MRLFQLHFKKETKCGGCNWDKTELFVLTDSKREARNMFEYGDVGLCADCMCELIADEEYEISLSPKRRKEWEKFIKTINKKK